MTYMVLKQSPFIFLKQDVVLLPPRSTFPNKTLFSPISMCFKWQMPKTSNKLTPGALQPRCVNCPSHLLYLPLVFIFQSHLFMTYLSLGDF